MSPNEPNNTTPEQTLDVPPIERVAVKTPLDYLLIVDRTVFLKLAFMLVFFTVALESVSADSHSTNNNILHPPKFLTENYLIAHERLVERLVPEERRAATRILDWMIDFMATGRIATEEIQVRVVDVERSLWVLEDRTDVLLSVPGYPMGFHASLFTIRKNHVVSIELRAEEYLCTTGCCYDTHIPKEYYSEFWEDLGKFSYLQRLEVDKDRVLDQNGIAELLQSRLNTVSEFEPLDWRQQRTYRHFSLKHLKTILRLRL